MAGLPGVDGGGPGEEVADLVGAGEEHRPGERIDVERKVLVTRQVDELALEVDRELRARIGPDELEELAVPLRLDDDRQEPVLQGVAPEDVGEAASR